MYYPTQDFTQTKGIVKYNIFTRHNHVQTKHKRKKPFVEKMKHTHTYAEIKCCHIGLVLNVHCTQHAI